MHAYDHYVDKTTHNHDGDLVTLSYDVLLKQLCAVQPYADYWFGVSSSHSSVCKVTSHFIWRHLIL